MRVMVTGAAGFVGSHLLPALRRAGHEPLPTDSRADPTADIAALDIRDADAVDAAIQRLRPGACIHLAGIAYRRGAYEAAKRYVGAFNQAVEPTAESLWLAIRIERRLGDRAAEASLVQQLRRRFPGSPEYQAFLQGQYQ